MTKPELISLATQIAKSQGLDPALVCAICATESSWKPYSIRWEPAFFHRYIESMKGLSETEKQMRACSFGLMQIMGQVAREYGFSGDFLTELFDPETGVKLGCKKLKRELDRHDGFVNGALLAYNGGGDANYPMRVMANYKSYAYMNSL